MTIVDILGQSIILDSQRLFIGDYKQNFDLTGYSKGVYLVTIQINEFIINKKVIIQ